MSPKSLNFVQWDWEISIQHSPGTQTLHLKISTELKLSMPEKKKKKKKAFLSFFPPCCLGLDQVKSHRWRNCRIFFQSCLRMILTCLLPLGLASSASLGLNLVETSHFSWLPGEEGEARWKSVLWVSSAAQNTQIQALLDTASAASTGTAAQLQGLTHWGSGEELGSIFSLFPVSVAQWGVFCPGFHSQFLLQAGILHVPLLEVLTPVPSAVSWCLPG